MRISDWSSDVCSSDLLEHGEVPAPGAYFVPGATLSADQARALGIRGEDDLLGGVVPRSFLATKTISHPAIGPDAMVPEGWSHELARALGDAVLPGYSTFSIADARVRSEEPTSELT